MKGSVLRKLKNDRYKSLTDEYIESIRAGYTVNIEEEDLSNYSVGVTRGMNLGPDVEKARFNPGQGAAGMKPAGLPLDGTKRGRPMAVPQEGQ
jgi:hypothetical protein